MSATRAFQWLGRVMTTSPDHPTVELPPFTRLEVVSEHGELLHALDCHAVLSIYADDDSVQSLREHGRTLRVTVRAAINSG